METWRPFPVPSLIRWLLALLGTLVMTMLALDGTVDAAESARADSSQGPRRLTIEERIAGQRAIEEVLWKHRIWPKENRGLKPPLSAVLSDTALRDKVIDTLKKSNALEKFWGRPLTAEQLQVEMDRMAKHTRQSDVLREVFDALDNDPTLIAECLVRPRLAENLLRSSYAFDSRFHSQLRDEAEQSLSRHPIAGGFRPETGEYREATLKADAGTPETAPFVSTDSGVFPVPRGDYESVLRDFRSSAGVIPTHFGALKEDSTSFFARAILHQEQDSTRIATWRWAKQPFEAWWSARSGSLDTTLEPQAGLVPVQTLDSEVCTDDTWAPLSIGAPDPRQHHTAVWTGTEMIVWGGITQQPNLYVSSGGRYEPATDTWSPTNNAVGEVPEARIFHSAIWTGTEMILWGGLAPTGTSLSSGGRYNPVSDTWTMTGTGTNLPPARNRHTAIWSGTAMIVWGGLNSSFALLNSGGRYDPALDAWTTTSQGANVSAGRYGHTATWTGTEMFVWGGTPGGGGLYNPASDSWRAVNLTLAPVSGLGHRAVWTGAEVIVWGGSSSPGSTGGGRFNPEANTWTRTSTTAGVPVGRQDHSAVWAKGEMIVWGGYSTSFPSGTQSGGRYDPANDTWTATGTGLDVPSARYGQTAVWTGTDMLVWGGYGNDAYLGTGGRYCRQCATSFGNYRDRDLDAYGDPADAQETCDSIPLTGYVSATGDCLDTNPAVHPAAPQLCDGINNDCSDPSWPVPPANEANADGDAFRICQGDCDDARNDVYPGAPQLCDGLNNDCLDGTWPTTPGNETDQDSDGFRICSPDCHDADPQVWAVPVEVAGLTAAPGTPTVLSWVSQSTLVGPETTYDVTGGTISGPPGLINLSAATCLQSAGGSSFTDTRPNPSPQSAYWYLARGSNSCGAGTYGVGSFGLDRDGTIPRCP